VPLKEWLEQATVTRGRHGLSAESVRQAQRGRLLAATAELAAEHGIRGVTAARLTDRAGVSRATLYSLFASKDGCMYAAAGEALGRLGALVSEAAIGRTADARLEATIDRFTSFCANHPNAARLGLVEIVGAGDEGGRLRNQALAGLTELLEEIVAEGWPDAPALTAELLAGGLWHLAGSRLCAGRAHELPAAGRLFRVRLVAALPAR
jgi:AcrR family transcriptional regulator